MRVIARHIIKKEQIAAYQEVVQELASLSRAEAGCTQYTTYQNTKDERIHCIIEGWQDDAAFKNHINSAHYLRLIPLITEMFDEAKTVEFYEPLN